MNGKFGLIRTMIVLNVRDHDLRVSSTIQYIFYCPVCLFQFKYCFFIVDEETGCSISDYTISIRRRWNYENNCAAIVCYVSTGNCEFSIFYFCNNSK